MTENKRFVNKGKDIFQYGEWWCSANGEHCADVIATAINELIEKNEQLKSENEDMRRLINNISYQRDEFHHGARENANRVGKLKKENEQLKEHLSTWRSSCCNYLNVYSILDNEVSILKETKDLDRFFEKFDKYSRMPFYEVEKSFIELQTENEQLKASLYAEKTNTAEVVNDYSKQFKRHSAQFSFMMDLADDLGVDVTTLEALDD